MKIIAGLSQAVSERDIAPYMDAGVDEFFIGYVPKKWSEQYGWEVSCNRRQTPEAQYKNIEDLETIVDVVHKKGRKVLLAWNAHEYGQEQAEMVLDIIESLKHIPFDAYIIGNVGLMLFLRKAGVRTSFNISIGAGCNNYQAIQFYTRHIDNIGRIILPRKLTMNEIQEIAENAGKENVKLEVFGLHSPCLFNDEACFSWHGAKHPNFCLSPLYHSSRVTPILFERDWKRKIDQVGRDQERKARLLEAHYSSIRDKVMKHFTVDLALETLRQNVGICGLCCFTRWKEWGIDAVKIALRGLRIKGTELIEIARKVIDAETASPEYCKQLIGSPGFCDGRYCYYDYPYAS